ncbi:MAG TPA: PP2C family serine/threonine-protein phosphatase [Acidimicrobiales bacterium]|nr:PP2C family serine/threonine-protein phosphatase [Acidimicrobiales bacterium]
MTTLVAAGTTDPGQVRTQNQDAFFVGEDLILIADGMGGYAGGEVAAQIAADVVGAHFVPHGTATDLEAAVADANRQIYERGVEPGLEGMGTTLVAAAVVGGAHDKVLVANVGDSRGYLLRAGTLRQLTEDHSVAAELVRLGRLEEDEGHEHPGRHVLTRALGVDRDVAPDLIELSPLPGDRLLLCSDGLSNELDDHEILSLLMVGEPSDAARALVAAANAHGGLDNITAVVADVVDVDEAGPDTDTGTASVADPAPASPVDDEPRTTAVPVVVPSDRQTGVAPVATSVGEVPHVLAVRPVLSSRDRRRRRREDRRARRAINKWVSFRSVLFLAMFGAVLAAAWLVLQWYGTQNFVVTEQHHRIVVEQGQPGGFLIWPQHVVNREPYGVGEIAPKPQQTAIKTGVQEPTLHDAMAYVRRLHRNWLRSKGLVPAGSSTSTTTSTVTVGGT